MGEVTVSDITYIPLIDVANDERTFCYASLVLDSYSKILVGYSVGPTLETIYPWRLSTSSPTSAPSSPAADK